MTRRLFYTDHCVLPLPPEHKFPIGKYRMLRELLVKAGFFTLEEAPLAHMATIVLAHDAEYVEAFLQGTLSAGAMRRIGFPWSPGLVRRTLASVGSTLAATREAVATGWGGTLAGGGGPGVGGGGMGWDAGGRNASCVRGGGVGVLRVQRYRNSGPMVASGALPSKGKSGSN